MQQTDLFFFESLLAGNRSSMLVIEKVHDYTGYFGSVVDYCCQLVVVI